MEVRMMLLIVTEGIGSEDDETEEDDYDKSESEAGEEENPTWLLWYTNL